MVGKIEITFSVILFGISLFLIPNFRQDIGMFYAFMALVYLISLTTMLPEFIFDWDKIEGYRWLLMPIIIGIGWIGIGSILLGQSFSALYSPLQAIQATPELTAVIWGILIPIWETMFFFGFLMPIFFKQFGKDNITKFISILIVGLAFSMFHWHAHLMESSVLIFDLIFAVISGYIVAYEKSLRSATIIHIIANLVALGVINI